MNIHKWLPQTLFMRLVMVWLCSLFILKIITLLSFNDWSERSLFRHMVNTESRLLSLYTHVLNRAFSDKDITRDKSTQIDPNLKVVFSSTQPILTEGSPELSQLLKEHIVPFLDKGHISYSNLSASAQVMQENNRVDQSSILGMRLPSFNEKCVVYTEITLYLENKGWLHLMHTMDIFPSSFIQLQAMRLIGELIFMLLATLAVVYWIIRPLAALASSAEKIGHEHVFTPLSTTSGPKEVRDAADAFNRMQQRIKDQTEERGQILAAVSHDLRTPLTRLRLRLEHVESESLREKLVRDVDTLRRTLDTTINLVRSLQDASAKEAVEIMPLVQELVAERQEVGQAVSLQGKVNCTLMLTPSALTSCLENLIDNALRYGGQGEVQVQVYEQSTDAKYLCLDVLDNGPGIPEESLEMVFKPYCRLEQSRNVHTGGYGLGLAIARNLAKQNDGNLTLHNRPQSGLKASLKFKITL